MKKIHLFTIEEADGEIVKIFFEPTKIRNCSIIVRRKEDYSATFHPTTITYTGATVGGVHTGGFHINEAHYSYKSSMTGYGELTFTDYNGKNHTVHGVTFNPEISAIAKKVLTRCFSSETEKGITYMLYSNTNNVSQDEYMSAMSSGNGYTAASIINRTNKNYAPASHCQEMGAFLLRVIHGEFLASELKCSAVDALLSQNDPINLVIASNIMRNPQNAAEKKKATLIEDKLKNTQIYRYENRVYKDKSVYMKQVFKKKSEKMLIPSIAIGVLLMAIGSFGGPGFIAILGILVAVGGFLPLAISANISDPDANDFYDC